MFTLIAGHNDLEKQYFGFGSDIKIYKIDFGLQNKNSD